MVRVPLPQQVRRVPGSNGFQAPGVIAPTGAGASGAQFNRLGQAMLQSGLAVSQAASDLQERLDVIQVKKAQALALEDYVGLTRAFKNLRGESATGDHAKQAFAKLEEKLQGYGEGLSDIQGNLYRQRVAAPLLLKARQVWGDHEDQQSRVADIATSTAVLAGKVDDAILEGPPQDLPPEPEGGDVGGIAVGQDPVKRVNSVQSVIREAENLGRKLGMPPEQIERFVLGETTKVHAGRVESLVNSGRSTEAGEYLSGVEKQVEANTLIGLRKVVRGGSVGEEAASRTVGLRDEIIAEYQQGLRERQVSPSLGEQVATTTAEIPAVTLLNEGLARIQEQQEAGLDRDVANAMRGELRRMADERGDVEVESKRATYEEGKQYFLENRQSSVDTLRIDNPVLYQRGQDLELIDDWNVFANSPSQRGSTDKELFFRLSKTNGDGLFQMKRNDFVELMSRRMNDADFKVAIGLYNRANQFDDSNLTSEVSTEDIIQEIARDRELLDRGGPGSSLKLQGATYYNFRVAALNSIRSFEVAELQGRRKSTAEEQRQQVLKVANEKFFSNIGAPDPLLPLAAMSELQKTGLTEAERREFGASGESPGRRGAFLNADLMTQYWQENNPPGTPVPPAITNSDDVYLGEIPPSASKLITEKLIEDGTPVTPTAILVRWVQSRGVRR